MDKILETAPQEFLPTPQTKAFLLLEILSDGDLHTTLELTFALGCDPRSALQALTGEQLAHWLIHNRGSGKGMYQLDERHLSGNPELDREARVIAFKKLKERSKKQCESETHRYPKAQREFEEAIAMFQQHFNFSEEKPNPA